MRPLWKDIVTAFIMGMVLPALFLNFSIMLLDAQRPVVEIEASVPAQSAVKEESRLVKVRNDAGKVTRQKMDEYLVGVLLGEMPASFEVEALKAQSVVARTYAEKANSTGGKHGDGSVCTRASCCQGFVSKEAYLEQGGTEEGIKRVEEAVKAVSGLCLAYEGELIEATYFSCSGGYTEAAISVWGTDYPYLQAVSSPGEEDAAYYTDTRHFTAQAFQNALGETLDGSPAQWFGKVTYTDGGGVEVMNIGEKEYTGTQLRALLNLRSTAFTVSVDQQVITITTRGYGHRVGMSQYGADAMAAEGKTFRQILAHYYPGTELVELDSNSGTMIS